MQVYAFVYQYALPPLLNIVSSQNKDIERDRARQEGEKRVELVRQEGEKWVELARREGEQKLLKAKEENDAMKKHAEILELLLEDNRQEIKGLKSREQA